MVGGQGPAEAVQRRQARPVPVVPEAVSGRRQERHPPHGPEAGCLGYLQEGIEGEAASAPGRVSPVPQARQAHVLHADQRPQHHPGGRPPDPPTGHRSGASNGAAALRRGHSECHGQAGGQLLVHHLPGGHRRTGTAPVRPLAPTWASRRWPRCGTGTNRRTSSTCTLCRRLWPSYGASTRPSPAVARCMADTDTVTDGRGCMPSDADSTPRSHTCAVTTIIRPLRR